MYGYNSAFQTLMYEIAARTLPRVALKNNPKVVGLVVQKDDHAGTTQVHWGVSDRSVFLFWYNNEDLQDVVSHWSTQIGEYTEEVDGNQD